MTFIRFFVVAVATLAPFSTLAQTPAPAAPATAAPTAPSANAPVTRAEIPDLVKQAILNDPDMIMQAAQKLRDKQAAEGEKHAQDELQQHKGDLFEDNVSPSLGNTKNPDVTVVEFFDYHCGYCKHLLPAVTQLIQDDKKVRVVFKEFPILSADSVVAARAALAVYNIAPDKYFDFHTALMESTGRFDEKTIMTIAKKEGINPDKLKAEMGKPEISAELDKNRTLGSDMGISGTPALVIGNKVVPGALPYDDLKKAVDEARNSKSGDAPKS